MISFVNTQLTPVSGAPLCSPRKYSSLFCSIMNEQATKSKRKRTGNANGVVCTTCDRSVVISAKRMYFSHSKIRQQNRTQHLSGCISTQSKPAVIRQTPHVYGTTCTTCCRMFVPATYKHSNFMILRPKGAHSLWIVTVD